MRWKALLIGITTAVPLLVRAEVLPIKAYTTADGLASDRVNRVVADSRGFLWIATPEGLSRFDGRRFVNYGVDDGLPEGAVVAVREGRSGDRWIAAARGLSRIDGTGQAGRMTRVTFEPGPDAGSIVALATSKSHEIWVATARGLFESIDRDRFRRVQIPLVAGARLTDIAEDSDGCLWVGTNAGIIVLDDTRVLRTFTLGDGLPGVWVETLFRDSRGRMWAAIRGGLAQFRSSGAAAAMEHVYSDELVGSVVTSVTEASDSTIWVGTFQGISRLRWDGGPTPTVENLTRDQGLSDRWITALAQDPSGNMWVGTESAGLMRVGRLGFVTYHEPDGLSSDRVWSVFEDRTGDLLAVTIPQGRRRSKSVDILTGGRFHRMAPRIFADNPTWAWNQILLQSRTGEWWGATSQGLCRFGIVKAADLDGQAPRACYAGDMMDFSVFEDSRGRIWASGSSATGDRLMRWDPETDAVLQFPHSRIDADGGTTANSFVTTFAEDAHGNIWMGLYGGGMYRYDGRVFQHLVVDRDGVPGGPIIALLAARSGLWIGSDGGGLARIADTDARHPAVTHYTRATGMSSDTIECLVEDRAGHIYAGTGQGVDRLDPASAAIRHFSTADGLGHGAFHGAARDRSGALWFATTQGLSRLVPGDVRSSSAPPTFITDLHVGGEPYPVSEIGEARIAPPDLEPSGNELQVGFAALEYEPGSVVRYAYKLEGADAKWSRPSEQPSVSYAALKAGTYRFLVKAVTSDGAESASPAEIDFTVLAPMWKRWWFLTAVVSTAAGLVLAAHRYRVAHIVSLERMRTAIATDLHDDLGASLSQIAILSEVARLKARNDETSEPLARVATLARELVDSLGDIVWEIRSEPGRWDSLVLHMREFGLDVLASQDIDFRLRTPSTAGPSMSLRTRRQLFLMFKECMHNCARHSRCSSVVAELDGDGREVTLVVTDDGVGMGSDDASRSPGRAGGSGIPGMRRRAESLGGHVQITSAPGQGCRVEIHVPC